MDAVGFFVRAALCNTIKMKTYDRNKSKTLVELANKNLIKLGMEVKEGTEVTLINSCDANFLWREFCKAYMSSK